jgi:predicted adenine nucleotide alpha hydrolase (AANH) superfamily ATPase
VAAIVAHYAEHFQNVKQGKAEPERCEQCPYCRETKVLTGPVEYEDIIETDY